MTEPSPRAGIAAGAARPSPGSRPRGFSDLLPRVMSGAVMVAVALATAYFGGVWFAVLWWGASVAVNWEWQRLVSKERVGWRVTSGTAALSVASASFWAGWFAAGLLLILVGAILVGLSARRAERVTAALGMVYAGALLGSVSVLRHSVPFGFQAIVFLFAAVWATDVMAYFGGRLVGGPKLWPQVSPSKTWAGFLIGVGFGGVAGWLVASATGAGASSLLLGIVLGAVAQGGDLFESSLKRRFGAKDSGHLIPGHGGVMDRLDGFLAAATVAALLGVAREGLHAP